MRRKVRSKNHYQFSFLAFLVDHILQILVVLAFAIILTLFLIALKTPVSSIILVLSFLIALELINFLISYFRRRYFYQHLLENLAELDQAYLILETIERPNFYDGQILFEVLSQVNKSAAENVQKYASKTQDFREYVELWIHEAKTPLATLSLLTNNHQMTVQLKRLDDYVEQVLYFVRAENAERDYMIKPTDLTQVVQMVALRNRTILQAKRIDFKVENLSQKIHTDAKWLEFILNQILANSIKYQSTQIEIRATHNHDTTILEIHDNGIGIREQDLPRVFEKSFTGCNGRQTENGHSTGMGLYLVKMLCDKLGHQVSIESKIGQGTTVTLTFADHNYLTDVL